MPSRVSVRASRSYYVPLSSAGASKPKPEKPRKRKHSSYAEREAVRRETAAPEPELNEEIAKVAELADAAHHASANVHHERAAQYYALLSRIFATRALAIRHTFGDDDRDKPLPEVPVRPRRAGDRALRPCTRARRP